MFIPCEIGIGDFWRGMNFFVKLINNIITLISNINAGRRMPFIVFRTRFKVKKQILIPIRKNHVALTHVHSI